MMALILVIGYAAVGVHLIAAGRIHRNFAGAYPAVLSSILFSSLRIALGLNFSFETRRTFGVIGAPIDLLLGGLAIIEVFRATTANHFPVRRWGTLLLATIAAVSACASALSRGLLVGIPGEMLRSWHMLDRVAYVWMASFLVLTWAFLRHYDGISESRASSAAVLVLGANATMSLANAVLMGTSWGASSWWVLSVMPVSNGLVTGLLWATVFAGASAAVLGKPKVNRRALRAGEARMDQWEAELRCAVVVVGHPERQRTQAHH